MPLYDDLEPRLDVLLDYRTPWSAEKTYEAIKLHALMLWPKDEDGRADHINLCIGLYVEALDHKIRHAKKHSIATRSGSHLRDLEVARSYIRSNIMSLRRIRRNLLRTPDVTSYQKVCKNQILEWRRVIAFVDFTLKFQASDTTHLKSGFSKKKFEMCAEALGMIETGTGSRHSTISKTLSTYSKVYHFIYADHIVSETMKMKYNKFKGLRNIMTDRSDLDLYEGLLGSIPLLRYFSAVSLCVGKKIKGHAPNLAGMGGPKEDFQCCSGTAEQEEHVEEGQSVHARSNEYHRKIPTERSD